MLQLFAPCLCFTQFMVFQPYHRLMRLGYFRIIYSTTFDSRYLLCALADSRHWFSTYPNRRNIITTINKEHLYSGQDLNLQCSLLHTLCISVRQPISSVKHPIELCPHGHSVYQFRHLSIAPEQESNLQSPR